MNGKNIIPARVDPDFMKELKDIKLERIKNGIDKDLRSDRRLTRALIRSSLWKEVKDVLINSPMDEDNIEANRRNRRRRK